MYGEIVQVGKSGLKGVCGLHGVPMEIALVSYRYRSFILKRTFHRRLALAPTGVSRARLCLLIRLEVQVFKTALAIAQRVDGCQRLQSAGPRGDWRVRSFGGNHLMDYRGELVPERQARASKWSAQGIRSQQWRKLLPKAKPWLKQS
jgi:hypothetical protein